MFSDHTGGLEASNGVLWHAKGTNAQVIDIAPFLLASIYEF